MANDMEQWVSDSFYSYFPSLNVEKNKERENKFRQQQQEYKNYIKKKEKDELNRKRNQRISLPVTSRSDPYSREIQSYSDNDSPRSLQARPSSTRQKLLQDLRHTNLSEITQTDAIKIRNQEMIEMENNKKKKYQEELMRQIEDKRNQIEVLKYKEQMEEEALTRKLEQQLKTMELTEELERAKINSERARYEVEQNKMVRQRLLRQLENDSKLQEKGSPSTQILSDKTKPLMHRNLPTKNINKKISNVKKTENSDENNQKIKNQKRSSIVKKNCAHTTKICCPFCDMRLKKYESWCDNCKIPIFDDGAENRSMICENCDAQYFICSACDKENGICKFCRRKRSICLNCIINFCVHCGHAASEGKKVEEINANEKTHKKISSGNESEQSFKVLDYNTIENINDDKPLPQILPKKRNFSINLKKNSIFRSNSIDNHVQSKDMLAIKNDFDDKMSRYLKNYGDLPEINQQSLKDMTLLPSPEPSAFREYHDHETSSNSRFLDDLTAHWEIPAVEKRKTNVVFTQIGAVRRQLQLDRLQLDNNTSY